MTSNTNLPKALERPVDRDYDKVAALTGVEKSKIGGKKGYHLPDKEEGDLVYVLRNGYFRCIDAGNPKPTLEHIIGVNKTKMREKLRDATGKGNAYGKLLIPALDGRKSPYWSHLEALLRDPQKYGFDGILAIRKDVVLEPTGRDAAKLPGV